MSYVQSLPYHDGMHCGFFPSAKSATLENVHIWSRKSISETSDNPVLSRTYQGSTTEYVMSKDIITQKRKIFSLPLPSVNYACQYIDKRLWKRVVSNWDQHLRLIIHSYKTKPQLILSCQSKITLQGKVHNAFFNRQGVNSQFEIGFHHNKKLLTSIQSVPDDNLSFHCYT